VYRPKFPDVYTECNPTATQLTKKICHFTVQFPYLDTWKVFKGRGEGGVGIRLASVYDSANTTSAKTLITYIRVIMPAPAVVAADAFGTGIVH
jgi:hypothetical protein